MPSHPGLHEAFSESKDDNGVLLALEYGVWLPPLPGILGAGLGLLRALWGQEPDPDSPTSAPLQEEASVRPESFTCSL